MGCKAEKFRHGKHHRNDDDDDHNHRDSTMY